MKQTEPPNLTGHESLLLGRVWFPRLLRVTRLRSGSNLVVYADLRIGGRNLQHRFLDVGIFGQEKMLRKHMFNQLWRQSLVVDKKTLVTNDEFDDQISNL